MGKGGKRNEGEREREEESEVTCVRVGERREGGRGMKVKGQKVSC